MTRGITMSQARKVVSASKRHKLISVGMLAGMLALAASMVPATASTASPRFRTRSGALYRSGPSGPAPNKRTSRPCSRHSSPRRGINVNYSGKGSNMDTAIDAAVAGGVAPAGGARARPEYLNRPGEEARIQPFGPVIGSEASDYGAAWNNLVTYNGKLYGVWFKGANKNTIWYNPAEFAAAGLEVEPKTWQQLARGRGDLEEGGRYPVLALHRRRLARGRLLAERVPEVRRRGQLRRAGSPQISWRARR